MNDELFLRLAQGEVQDFLRRREVGLLDNGEFEFAGDGGFDGGSVKFGVALRRVRVALPNVK